MGPGGSSGHPAQTRQLKQPHRPKRAGWPVHAAGWPGAVESRVLRAREFHPLRADLGPAPGLGGAPGRGRMAHRSRRRRGPARILRAHRRGSRARSRIQPIPAHLLPAARLASVIISQRTGRQRERRPVAPEDGKRNLRSGATSGPEQPEVRSASKSPAERTLVLRSVAAAQQRRWPSCCRCPRRRPVRPPRRAQRLRRAVKTYADCIDGRRCQQGHCRYSRR